MDSGLSEEAKNIAERFTAFLRREYKDGCRDRLVMSHALESLHKLAGALPPAQSRDLLRTIRPLYGYESMALAERRHRIIETGRALDQLTGTEPPRGKQEIVFCQPEADKMLLTLATDIGKIHRLGDWHAQLLNNLGIRTIFDLITYYPKRWEDRGSFTPIAKVPDGALVTVKGVLGQFATKTAGQRNIKVTETTLADESGSIKIVWFNQSWQDRKFNAGQKVLAFGKAERDMFGCSLKNAEVELERGPHISTGRIVPVYALTGKMTQEWLRRLMFRMVPTYAPAMPDSLPPSIVKKYNFISEKDAVVEYHWPSSYHTKDLARERLAYEELLILQIQTALRRRTLKIMPRSSFYERADYPEQFLKILPFTPTGAQRRVFIEILNDLTGGQDTLSESGDPSASEEKGPMNRLVQGDVGSGKTAVAAFAAFMAVKNGHQAALMAPTEILASQHFQKMKALLEPAGIRVGRLQGCMTKKAKEKVYAQLKAHELDFAVGTHALIQEGVEFDDLSLVIVDEQHKFGVMQRTELRRKGMNPDMLVMTATPIPRTLSLTIYGDLDASRLDELPPGRQPIQSKAVPYDMLYQVNELIRSEINKGRQAYIVCALIDETDKIEAAAAIAEAQHLREKVFPEFSVGLLHGRMKASEKNEIMQDFHDKKYQILISTTVIEVGVDVPNATLMVVRDADRFGLSQLHQLRGRIGRGQYASTCIFVSGQGQNRIQRKLQAIAKLSDGFEVAEEDLEIRGPGDYYGVRQSGLPEFKVADLLRDKDMLWQAKNDAFAIIAEDHELAAPEHRNLKEMLKSYQANAGEMIH